MATIISQSQLPSSPTSPSSSLFLLTKAICLLLFASTQSVSLGGNGQLQKQSQQLRNYGSLQSPKLSPVYHEQTSGNSQSVSSSSSLSSPVSALNVIPPPVLSLPVLTSEQQTTPVHNISNNVPPFIEQSPPPPLPPPFPPPLLISTRSSLQEKLHSASQSLNDLFSDLLAKPLGLSPTSSSTGNSSSQLLLSLEALLAEKVKLPRPLNALLNTLSSHSSYSHSNSNVNINNLNSSLSDESDNELGSLAASEAAMTYSRLPANQAHKIGSKKKISGGTSGGRCYEPYGCYRVGEPPFHRSIYRPINLLPEPPMSIRVTFNLRTRANPSVAERLPYSESVRYIKSAYFHPGAQLKVIVHGYLESGDEHWIRDMSAALLDREDVNVICVDWSLGASPPYTQAVANTRLVGAIVAHFIRIIQDTYPDRYLASSIHLIGHSLGAHISGYTGSLVSVGHITGLDPAEPYFQYTDPLVRLDPGDAEFVDVVHTDGASIISGGFGMNQSCGHVDFYPNGGVSQPGCKETPIKNVWDSISKEKTVFDGIRRFIGCNHLRSFLLYTEAINSECPFMAYPCLSYEDFSNGHCTGQLMEAQYDKFCFQQANNQKNSKRISTITSNLTACPIRMGLNSQLDFRRQMSRLHFSSPSDHHHQNYHQKSISYFLQTSDRAPFCHYHYDLKVVLRVSPHRLFAGGFRSFSQHLLYNNGITDNLALLNGRILVTIIGSRSRTVAEIPINRQSSTNVDNPSEKTEENTERMSSGQTYHHHLKEVNVLFSEADLGTIRRLELEWRPSSPLVPFSTNPFLVGASSSPIINPARPLMANLQQMQSRALRRWWVSPSQSSTLEASNGSPFPNLPAVLNELQRTFTTTINATSLQATTNHLLGVWAGNGANENHPFQAKSLSESNNLVDSPPQQPSHKTSKTSIEGTGIPQKQLPLLESVILTKLETGEQQVFCSKEPSLKMLFQGSSKQATSGSSLKTGILINGKSVKNSELPSAAEGEPQLPLGESLTLQLCIRDIF